MLRFKEYLQEEVAEQSIEDLSIDVDSDTLLNMIENINDSLDAVTEKPFVNSAIFINAVRGTLERYGVILPAGYEMPMLSMDAETVYKLGDTGYHLYIVHNSLPDIGVDGYATIANAQELEDLMSGEEEEDEDDTSLEREPIVLSPYLRQTRRTNDDSGNTDEY